MAWPSKWPTGQKVCFLLFIFGILLTIEGWVSIGFIIVIVSFIGMFLFVPK
jgi:Zn-dependent membrane protease YugP